MIVLTVNAGSSSLKLRLLRDEQLIASADLHAGASGIDAAELLATVRPWPAPDVIGHRVVHGGTEFTGPVIVDGHVRAALEALTDLAPLHQPKSLRAMDAVSRQFPTVLTTASFDTAFHASLPAAASTYAIPREWRERSAIRRYGFHGLSHQYCARRAAELAGRSEHGSRIVTCHLGAGASLAAVVDGRSVDTTMGFTPLEGLVMATRSGSVDPGLVLWLAEHEHLSTSDIAIALEERSGLMGLAGTGDMREVERAASAGSADAELALAVHHHRLVAAIASMVAAAGGIDVLAFTGGVGEHSTEVRARAARALAFVDVTIDATANELTTTDADISAAGAAVRTVVVTAREDVQIARDAVLLASGHRAGGTTTTGTGQ